MSFVTAALIGGGVAIAGGLLNANAAQNAASTQADASRNATQAQLQMFNTINGQQAPYRQSGYNALAAINSGLGLGNSGNVSVTGTSGASGNAPTKDQFTTIVPGKPAVLGTNYGSLGPQRGSPATPATTTFDQAGYDAALANFNATQGAPGTSMPQTGGTPASGVADGYFTHQFNASDLNSNLAPNYQFQLDQGLGAVKNAGNLQTGLLSGNTLKGINDYAQNYAGNAYQNAFQNYTANQTNIYNRLANIAGLGQTANQSSGQVGAAISPGISSSIQNTGAAQAAGQVGTANAITGGANNALGWYTLSQIMNNNG